MKTLFILGLTIFSISAFAQEAKPFDKAAATAALSVEAVRPKVFTKAADPITLRTYTKSGIVRITHASGNVEELPYVEVPILFVVGRDQLLDHVSKENVEKTAEVLRTFLEKGSSFCIEGHASAEGDSHFNKELSKARAAKILTILTESYALDSSKLSARGLGSDGAQFPAHASEHQLQQDRRVLVVKLK